MEKLSNKLLKKSELASCLCAPGVVAEALEHLMRGEAAEAALADCVRCDPVLALRLRAFSGTLAGRRDIVRALLLAAPVASGASQVAYAARWRQSITVAHLAQALGARAGIVDAEAAWSAGLGHNLAQYVETAAGATPVETWLADLDDDGWIADAVRYHAEPLARGRAAHPLVRVVQLAFQLATCADAADRVDVRAALATLHIPPGEAATMRAESEVHARQLGLRFGLSTDAAPLDGGGFERLARLYALQAAQAALQAHFRPAHEPGQVFALLQDTLCTLFGLGGVCLFAHAGDGSLKLSPLMHFTAGLAALSIPPDDGHSALARALAGHTPQQFVAGEPDGALVDEQIARLLGATRLSCQPLPLPDGQRGVLVVGDAAPDICESPLWQFTLGEYRAALRVSALAHQRDDAPIAAAVADASGDVPTPGAVPAAPATGLQPASGTTADPRVARDDIPRDRVRRAVHEVANPLTIMRNYVNLLSDRLNVDPVMQRDLAIISDEIERVARIIRSLTLADDSVAAPDVNLELVSVNGVVSELVRLSLGTLFAPNKITVQIDLDPDVPPLPLHKDLLKQVLFNLAKNAVEAMPAGGHLKFTTRPSEHNGQRVVEIEVADTGPGLPAHVISKLFEPVESDKGGDHAGLGLNISRTLVERMNGQLTCDSTSQGTHFLIRLPALQNGQPSFMTTRYGSM